MNRSASIRDIRLQQGLGVRRSMGRNLSAIAVAELAARSAQVAIVLILARWLGSDGMGVFGTGWALYAIALPWVQNAPELIGMRELGRHPRRLSIIGEINVLKLATAVVTMGVVTGLALTIYSDRPSLSRQVIAQAAVLAPAALGVGWAFRALQQVEVHAGLRVLQAFGSATALLVLIDAYPHPLMVPLVEFVFYALIGAGGFAILRHRAWRTPGVAAPRWLLLGRSRRALRRHGFPIAAQGLAGVASAITWNACIPVAGFFWATGEVGQLAAALRLTLVLNGSLLVALQLFLPLLARAHEADVGTASAITARLAGYVALGSVLSTFVVVASAESLCPVLLGPEFAGAAALVRILALGLVPAGIGAVYGYSLLAARHDRAFLWCMLAGAFASVAVAPASFAILPPPLAMVFLPGVILAQTVALMIYAHRVGVLQVVVPCLRWLSPNEFRAFMESR